MNLVKHIISYIFPARCLACGEEVSGEDGICAKCFAKFHFIGEQRCSKCGRAFEFGNGVCTGCLRHPPKFDSCISVCKYNEVSREIILPFKHADKTYLARFIARVMANAGASLILESDIIVPVPLAFGRLLKRKYNQSALIALKISKEKTVFNVLRRVRNSTQKNLSTSARRKNVKGAFEAVGSLTGKKVLVIDDVFTTGATLEECARALKKAGAARVYCLTFARV